MMNRKSIGIVATMSLTLAVVSDVALSGQDKFSSSMAASGCFGIPVFPKPHVDARHL
jgi:hypothetical protein